MQRKGKRIGEERDGHKPQPRDTDHCPLIPRREGVAAKKALNSQAGGEEEDEQPSRGRPPAWKVREGGTVQREGALQLFPLAWGYPQPDVGTQPLVLWVGRCRGAGGHGAGELSVSSLQRLVLSEVFL